MLDKYFSAPQRALMRKDFTALRRRRLTWSLLLLFPLVLLVGLTVLFTLVSVNLPAGGIEQVRQFERLLPAGSRSVPIPGVAFYAYLSLLCPLIFVLTPFFTAAVAASCSFVGERERGTMETLLLSPVSPKKIFRAKVFGCVLLSEGLTLASFVLFLIAALIGTSVSGAPLFFNGSWLILVLLLSPALSCLTVFWVAFFERTVKTTRESAQMACYVVFPFLVLFAVQLMGVFRISWWALLLLAVGTAAVDCLLFTVGQKRFAKRGQTP